MMFARGLHKARLSARTLPTLSPLASFSSSSSPIDIQLELKQNHFEIPPQHIFAGTESLTPFLAHLQSLSASRPLIVTDPGVAAVGVLDTVVAGFRASGLAAPAVFAETRSDPSVDDVAGIAEAYVAGGCDSILALGGGGPLDAGKAAAAVIAAVESKHASSTLDHSFLAEFAAKLKHNKEAWERSVPPLAAIPTTSGTGSEAGKSSVISIDGTKRVLGDMALMPKAVGLIPQLTAGMPAALTAATGVDALFHCMEALFVTADEARLDGMDPSEAAEANAFALRGIQLVLQNLDTAVQRGDDLETRLNMQLAAMFGAKAFRKGALGGVHATAHALGAHAHIHHGACIGRMSQAVLAHTIAHPNCPAETTEAYNTVRALFDTAGIGAGLALDRQVGLFLESLQLPQGIRDLQLKPADIDTLVGLAVGDPCQTNPVRLSREDYVAIFSSANAQ